MLHKTNPKPKLQTEISSSTLLGIPYMQCEKNGKVKIQSFNKGFLKHASSKYGTWQLETSKSRHSIQSGSVEIQMPYLF